MSSAWVGALHVAAPTPSLPLPAAESSPGDAESPTAGAESDPGAAPPASAVAGFDGLDDKQAAIGATRNVEAESLQARRGWVGWLTTC
jgi:hypothetical protein